MGRPSGPDEQYCTHCGELIDRDSTYCTYCGGHVGDGDPHPHHGDGRHENHRTGNREGTRATDDRRRDTGRPGTDARGPPDDRSQSGGERQGQHRDHSQPKAGHGQSVETSARAPARRRRGGPRREGQRDSRAVANRPTEGGPASPSSNRANGGHPTASRGQTREQDDRVGFSSEPRTGAGPVDAGASTDESRFRTVGVAVGLGIGGIIVLALVSLVGLVFLSALPIPEVASVGLSTAIGQYVGFVGLALGYLRYRGFGWETVRSYFGVRVPSLRDIGVVVLGYVTILVLLFVLAFIVQTFLPEPADNEGAQQLAESTTALAYAGVILMMFLVVGPCEEILYRGIVQNRLRERLSAIPAILLASIVFASVHVLALAGSDPVSVLVTVGLLFFPALVLGGVYEYTGNLVVPALLHSIHNSVIFTLLFWGPSPEASAGALAWLVALFP